MSDERGLAAKLLEETTYSTRDIQIEFRDDTLLRMDSEEAIKSGQTREYV